MRRTPSSRPLRVQLVGDVELAQHGLAAMLAHYAQVVTVLTPDAHDVAPDLVLYDPFMKGRRTAPEDLSSLGRVSPWVVWSWDRERYLPPDSGLPAPAGYLFKGSRAPRLVAELLRIDAGELVVSREERALPAESWAGQRYGLTSRQSEVLVAMARGRTNAEIGREVSLSPNTVKSYVRLAYRTIGVTNRSDAILWCVSHGLRRTLAASAAGSDTDGPRAAS